MPAISVLMPLYNGARYLPAALRSLFWQTFTDWELVIVDDGSQDGSLDLARACAQHDARVRVIAAPHRGIVATLNEGLTHCRAPWIARMDSDDIACPRRLERQWEMTQLHPDIAVWGSFVRLFPQLGRTLGMRRYERWLNRNWQSQQLERDIFVESPLVHPSVLMNADAVREAGGYRECPWPEDYDLWMRLWQRGYKMAKVPEVLLFWRDSPQRLTRVDARCAHARLRDLKLSYLISTYFPQCRPGDQTKEPDGSSNASCHNAAQRDGSSNASCHNAAQRYGNANAQCHNTLQLNASAAQSEPSHPPQRPVLVWGAGTNGKDLVKSLRERGLFPSGFVDNNPSRRGQKILGMPVYGLDQVSLSRGEFIVMAVSNPYIRAEVRAQLETLGAREGRDYVCLANVAKPTKRQEEDALQLK